MYIYIYIIARMFKIVNFLFFSSLALKIMGRNWNWNWNYKGRDIC